MDDQFWNSQPHQPRGRILYGRIGEENPDRPGTYRFQSNDGFAVNDAHLLSPDVDPNDEGEITRPRAGSPAVAAMTSNGAQCFILGFHRPPKFDDNSDDPPNVGNPDDNKSSGDKVYRTQGGATLILKRGGAVIVEGGSGTGIILNPLNNRFSMRAQNFAHSADGYSATRGRKEIGGTKPETFHREEFLHQVGPDFDRLRIEHGDVGNDVRRRLQLASVTVAASQETAIIRTRESYLSDGSWIGEGPKYQWGGEDANEPAVLGLELVDSLNKLADIIKNLKVNTAWGPSTPPIPPTPVELENFKNELSGKILSTFLFFSKDPADL